MNDTTNDDGREESRGPRRWITVAIGLVVLAAAAALAGNVIVRLVREEGQPGRLDAPIVAQVSLSWGGGAPRRWSGALTVRAGGSEPEDAAPEDVGPVAWIWLSDFEGDDHLLAGAGFPEPAQRVPADWRPTERADVGARPPAGGARIEGTTVGEADGVVLGLTTEAAELVLELDGTTLETSIEELLAAPVVVAADDEGNALLARAIDLTVDAPLSVPHGERTAWRTSLHTHSAFSTNEHPIDSTVASLRPFARTVFWTDHNTGDDRHVLAGGFEDRAQVERLWFALARHARIVAAGPTDDAAEGQSAFRLVAEPTGEGEAARAWIALQRGRGAGEFNVTLAMQPTLRWSWKTGRSPGSPSPDVAYVDVGLHSGRVLRYRSQPLAPSERQPVHVDAAIAVGGADAAGWRSFERDVAADVEATLGESRTDGLRRLSFGVECPRGRSTASFDAIELELPAPDDVVRLQQRVFDEYPALRSFVALEQSAWLGPDDFGALFPHLTAYVPDRERAPELFVAGSYDAAPSAADRVAFVRAVHEAGGAVGAHHLQFARHYEGLLDAGGLGIDLFEVGGAWHSVPSYVTPDERRWRDALGYPRVTEDELFPLLVRWDRATARGLLFAVYGAPDLHGRFERPNGGWLNRWLTSIVSADGSARALIAALRSGQASASEWRSDAVLTLAVDGKPWTGKLVATDRASHAVTAELSGALPGSRMRWIRGPLVRARAQAPNPASEPSPEPPRVLAVERVDAAELTSTLTVDTRTAAFVRAELRDPTGHWVALSNAVVFVPYWPARWPAGRVAFERDGVELVAAPGVRLDDARPDASGLVVRGIAEPEGRLVLAGAALSSWELAGDAHETREPGTIESPATIELDRGPFELRLGLRPAPADVATVELEALPERKELAVAIDVGVPASEASYALQGFGPPFEGPIGLAHHRAVGQEPASFRLPLPSGEPVWVRLSTQGFWTASGRLELDGRTLGTFERMASATFEVPASAGGGWRTFTLRLDPPAPGRSGQLLLHRIEMWRGRGVVDY